ncbi:MAG: sigma-70 family RNA polymerase sigma factor [Candidatus Eremiobacteraeota bacterium]|nr:sigma-70 family RNA polymerase sigma factor [Candidatus Eremiobacteraeota bacterium]
MRSVTEPSSSPAARFISRIAPWASVRDESLETSFARRDADAYETAYRCFGARMHATALRLLDDRDAAAECVHDVFLHLWRRQNAYVAARGSLEAFLVTCARNRALTHVREHARRRHTAARLAVDTQYVIEVDPIERERIARALARLTEGQAAVVALAYYRGMPLSEVALQLGIPIGTVKGRLSAALQSLRKLLVLETSNGS